MYLLGLDIGSSSIKAALLDAQSKQVLALVQSPEQEMSIQSPQADWAEQDPEIWWQHVVLATKKLLNQTQIPASKIAGIGVAYQMHGLVCLSAEAEVLRPAIIWCDSRAVAIGGKAYSALGETYCLERYLNSPGNFTASKLKWVRDNEPHIYEKIRWAMLPGDYIAYRLTGEFTTTMSGLSEGMLWDFVWNRPSYPLLGYYQIDQGILPSLVPTFGNQGSLRETAAAELGLRTGTPLAYRAGDQPNNAFSLKALNPGDVAATGGTSGVVYGVVDQLISDRENRINAFAHVNHQNHKPRIGMLLCINGAGSLYRWIKQEIAAEGLGYREMEQRASQIPIASDGLQVLPFGNGAERMLGNQNPGASIQNLHFNRHGRAHLYRAALEGIAFSFVYGIRLMEKLGLDCQVIRVGNDNLFQSAIFSNTIAQILQCRIEMYQSTGAVGAAIGAGVGIECWTNPEEGFDTLKKIRTFEPDANAAAYQDACTQWLASAHFFNK